MSEAAAEGQGEEAIDYGEGDAGGQDGGGSPGHAPAAADGEIAELQAMLDEMDDVDFEYEGEMPPELALDPESRANYPFMRLTGPANVLIMPAIHSASISTKLVQALGGATVIGPILLGMSRSVQICPLSASVSKILSMATMAAYGGPQVTVE